MISIVSFLIINLSFQFVDFFLLLSVLSDKLAETFHQFSGTPSVIHKAEDQPDDNEQDDGSECYGDDGCCIHIVQDFCNKDKENGWQVCSPHEKLCTPREKPAILGRNDAKIELKRALGQK